jgi:beta-lactamase regulating signal transducer with metallopeptidase domain
MMFDSVIERLNLWGGEFARIAWPLFWQSSLLIAGMFVLEFFLRRKLRASVRHALWLVVLIKLLLPPSFASPSGIAWWLRPREVAPAKPTVASYVVTYGPTHASPPLPISSPVIIPKPQIHLSRAAWALFGTVGTGLALLLIMLVRWRLLRQQLSKSQPAPIWLQEMLHDTQRKAGCRRRVRLMLTDASISPALCGLIRPVIVLPAALVRQLRPDQLRAVLLHELFHLRNGDVWVNCFQSLLHIVFWWHPLLWFANARIRRIREEVVDDSVRLALGAEAENYAPTLLEVARLALARPLATLGLVGILESRNALKQRVDRLVNFPAPRRVGLSIISGLSILAFASVALPMGQAPPRNVAPTRRPPTTIYNAEQKLWYTFDQTFLDYFGSNGVNDLSQAFAQSNPGSNFLPNPEDSSVRPSESERFNPESGISNDSGAILERNSPVDTANSTVEIRPITENGSVNFDFASGITTATNGAVLTYGDTAISADSITLNRETGEIVGEGSVHLKKANTDIPLGSKFRSNVTRLYAQNQPSVSIPTRTIHTSSGKRVIMNKLEAIRLNHVSFDNLPLSEVVNYLQGEAKKRDPEGKGINFILNPNTDLDGAAGPRIDPATGLTVSAPQVEPADINGVAIRISPPLDDVRMLDVLDAIVKVANPRLRYSIEDYGIAFRLAGNATPVPLFTRVIKVDPNVFAQGLESVVGISVGNFQTGGQGGGGQQGNGNVTVPRVQVAPNTIGGQGGQGGASGGAQGGAGGISGVTRPTTAITPQRIQQFFANAGVDLTPPKNFYLNFTEGSLLVHATREDLDTIEKAVNALSTNAAQPATTRASATPSNPVSPATKQAKLPVLGDLPVAGSLYQVRTTQAAAANSPQTMTNVASSGTGDKLFTRIFKVDPHTFGESVRKTAGLLDNASPRETFEAFRKIVLSSGVELRPPASMFYNDRAGSLFVRATATEIDVIEQMVAELNTAPPQVNIRVRFVEVSGAPSEVYALNSFLSSTAVNSDTNGPVVTILTDPQFRVVLHALEQRDGTDVISESSVTTVSGRQAQVQNVDLQSIVKLNPQALVPPGVASSNVYVTEQLYLGPVLDIVPFASESGDTIQLTVTAKVTEFVGYDPPPENAEAVLVYLDGQATTTKAAHPRTHVRSMQTASALIYDGQTVVLGRPKDEMITFDKEGKALSAPSTSKKNLLVFVTATLIDAAGNPVRKAGPISTTPERN